MLEFKFKILFNAFSDGILESLTHSAPSTMASQLENSYSYALFIRNDVGITNNHKNNKNVSDDVE